MAKKSKTDYVPAIGRRKTATARIRLYKKKGPLMVNGQPIEEYFPGPANKYFYQEPFVVTGTLGKYSATIKVKGSGKNGQLGAVIHGLSRALVKADKSLRPVLKKKGFLTRDSRMKERRKPGHHGKARARPISPKR